MSVVVMDAHLGLQEVDMPGVGGREVNIVQWTGGTLLVVGVLVFVGYGVYCLSQDFFGSPDVPLPIQVAVPTSVVGILVLLGAVGVERLRRRKREQLGEVEY